MHIIFQDLLQFKDEAKPGGEAEVETDPGVDQNVRILNSIIEEVGSMSGDNRIVWMDLCPVVSNPPFIQEVRSP